MARVEYRAVRYPEAKANGWPDTEHDDDYHDDWTSVIYRFEDGVPVAAIATDGGEPEDQTLMRDWSWVPFQLQHAYESGWRDAMNQQNPPEATS